MQISETGRKFYRHDSGMGTVMEWVDHNGTTNRTLLCDSKYHSRKQWGQSGPTQYGLVTTVKFQDPPFNYPSMYVNGERERHNNNNHCLVGDSNWPFADYDTCQFSADMFGDYTDEKLNEISLWNDDNTFVDLTTSIYAAGNNDPKKYAAGYVRSIVVDNMKASFPSKDLLLRIFCDRKIIQQLDPTDDSGTRWLALPDCWTCSECDYLEAWKFDTPEACLIPEMKNIKHTVIPVIDLNPANVVDQDVIDMYGWVDNIVDSVYDPFEASVTSGDSLLGHIDYRKKNQYQHIGRVRLTESIRFKVDFENSKSPIGQNRYLSICDVLHTVKSKHTCQGSLTVELENIETPVLLKISYC